MKILTFDIEDWFHILDYSETKEIYKWESFESRIERNLDYLLSVLQKYDYKATFFVLGWIAEKYPHLIKKIDDFGYEIGNHTYSHLLLYEHSQKEIKADVTKANKIIEDIIGKKVTLFRAPGFSLTNQNPGVFEALAELEIASDSSIFPSSRGHGGYKNFASNIPCILDIKGYYIKEFPINKMAILSWDFVFSGGGYFRILPYFVQEKCYTRSDYVMTYFHPRDFDESQPVLKSLSLVRKYKSYVGLNNSKKKFQQLLEKFNFIDIDQATKQIDWNIAKLIKL